MADLSGFFGGLTQVASTVLPILGQAGVFGGPQQSPFPNLTQQWGPPRTLPGGAMATPAFFDMPGFDVAPQGMMSGMGGTCIQPRMGKCGPTYPSRVKFLSQTASGNQTVEEYARQGRSLLNAADLRAVKKVKRVARLARSAVGGR